MAKILGRWQAPDKGEVQPTPAFRLLRVGADLCVNGLMGLGYQGDTVFFVTDVFLISTRSFERKSYQNNRLPQFLALFGGCSFSPM
jgi:hypothetical protein